MNNKKERNIWRGCPQRNHWDLYEVQAPQKKYLRGSLQSTPDNSNLQGKLKKVRVIGISSYRG